MFLLMLLRRRSVRIRIVTATESLLNKQGICYNALFTTGKSADWLVAYREYLQTSICRQAGKVE